MPQAVTQAPLYHALACALRDLGHDVDLLPIYPRTRAFLRQAGERCLDFAGSYRAFYKAARGVAPPDLAELARFELSLARPETRPRIARAVVAARACFAQLLAAGRYQRVVLNNGAGLLCGAAKQAFEAHGDGVLWHTEAGFLPNTLVLDNLGVNRHGLLMGLDPELLPAARPETGAYLAELLSGRVQASRSRDRFDGWASHLASREMLRREIAVLSGRTPLEVLRQFVLPKVRVRRSAAVEPHARELGPYVFVPLQVHDDTQVLLNSHRIQDMASLVSTVAAALPDGARMVVKPHPMDRGRTRLDGVRRALATLGNRAVVIHDRPSMELVQHARAVVTLNSTVGFEGLLHGRPVAALGSAWYAKRGLATSVAEPSRLGAWLRDPSPPSTDVVLRVVSILRHRYLLAGGFRGVSRGEARVMAERVLGRGFVAGSVPSVHG